jgi:hypothetical protein
MPTVLLVSMYGRRPEPGARYTPARAWAPAPAGAGVAA